MISDDSRPTEVRIELGPRSYSVWVGSGLLADSDRLYASMRGDQALIVSNERVAPLYLEALTGALSEVRARTLILPDGETHKSVAQWSRIHDALVGMGALRDACLITLGGGVIGDLGGFAAATYMRGIDFIQIPTTLLAQVDAAVGGKTAINHRAGKNLIGAFHQPRLVLSDLDTLTTLGEREYHAGLAEIIKYGLIRAPDFLAWLDRNLAALRARDPRALRHAVVESVRHKAQLVAQDEREAGARALLNLGHTFGHALESLTDYRRYLHGEAVAIGTVLAARLAARLGTLSAADALWVERLLARAGLPVERPAELDPGEILEHMRRDKKNRAAGLRLVLLKGLGNAYLRADVDEDQILAVLNDVA